MIFTARILPHFFGVVGGVFDEKVECGVLDPSSGVECECGKEEARDIDIMMIVDGGDDAKNGGDEIDTNLATFYIFYVIRRLNRVRLWWCGAVVQASSEIDMSQTEIKVSSI